MIFRCCVARWLQRNKHPIIHITRCHSFDTAHSTLFHIALDKRRPSNTHSNQHIIVVASSFFRCLVSLLPAQLGNSHCPLVIFTFRLFYGSTFEFHLDSTFTTSCAHSNHCDNSQQSCIFDLSLNSLLISLIQFRNARYSRILLITLRKIQQNKHCTLPP